MRKGSSEGLTAKQKLTMFHDSGISAAAALGMQDEDITFDLLLRHVKPLNLITAGIRGTTLKKIGVREASQLRRLGFDALHLVDAGWCEDASAAYGASNIISAFLVSANDAVALSGSEAVKTLNISVETLLEACAGAPVEAASVLQQSTNPRPLQGVQASVLLDTGIRSQQLKQLGYGLVSLQSMMNLTAAQARKLGFV